MGLLKKLLGIEPGTHDYGPGNRYWGHDYTFNPEDGGMKASMCGWGHGIKAGDYLILDNEGRSTRYRVVEIKYFSDPSDMWSADVEFAPRKAKV